VEADYIPANVWVCIAIDYKFKFPPLKVAMASAIAERSS
jgi:hypothetical protein